MDSTVVSSGCFLRGLHDLTLTVQPLKEHCMCPCLLYSSIKTVQHMFADRVVLHIVLLESNTIAHGVVDQCQLVSFLSFFIIFNARLS